MAANPGFRAPAHIVHFGLSGCSTSSWLSTPRHRRHLCEYRRALGASVKRFFFAVLFSPVTTPLLAQSAASKPAYEHGSDSPEAFATRITTAIRVDGVLDEVAWQSAEPITGFTQLDPHEGQPASERSEVRFLYDDDALFIGARLYDRHPVRARVGRRDMSVSASDWLGVVIDAKHDHLTALGFEVNPAGVRRDQTVAGPRKDDSWDPVWEVHTSVNDSGWVAEIRIPFSQLRFSGAPSQTWGLQIERQIARNQEFSIWAFTPRDQPAGVPRFGHLTGLTRIPAGKRLELMPYVVARAEYVAPRGNPFRSNREYVFDAGADLKYRVTSSLTLDATANPDFGQVEVDPAVINLTAFETFFPEKRPFFIEGAETFRFGAYGANNVFYSRRIGRQPSLTPPYAARDVPDATRILGAAKLTGRSGSGWAIGVLDAVTQREIGRFRTPDGQSGEVVAEPLTNYFVGRARREIRSGQTSFGGLIGAVNRDLRTPELSAALRSAAYSGGVDVFHQWARRTVTLEAFVAATHIRGERSVIAAAQRLPYHYFQRPDADHLDYDTTRTSLNGFAGSLTVSKQFGRHWNGGAGVNVISPGYEVSDLGFQRRADRVDFFPFVNYQDTRPRGMLRRHRLYASMDYDHNFGWESNLRRVYAGGSVQFLSYWQVNADVQTTLPGSLDDRLTRGGPAARRPRDAAVFGRVTSDPRKPVVGSLGTFVQRGENGRTVEVSPNVSIKPASYWEFSLGPSFTRRHDVAQYLQRVPDTSATRTLGARYVFAELDQTTFAVQARVNYTFTPALSLQIFAQPLVAAGDFGPAKEFAAPREYEFLVYGVDVGEVIDGRIYPTGDRAGAVSFPAPDRDFNVGTLRGNAVLRWEWRAGSTFYVVWQQTRSDTRAIGDFDLDRDVGALFASAPDDILLVKVSYWFNP